ncbi:hypothetical protein P9112_005176 [Eukaryota sp. TZLM1-RC]
MSRHNTRRSSIRIGSPLGGSIDTSETVRTDPPTSYLSSSSSRTPHNASSPHVSTPFSGDSVTKPNASSSSSQTPQLGTELPSGGERSDTSSHLPGQGSTPSTDFHVVPISLPVPPSNVENFVPLSPPPGSEGEVENSLLGPEQFST